MEVAGINNPFVFLICLIFEEDVAEVISVPGIESVGRLGERVWLVGMCGFALAVWGAAHFKLKGAATNDVGVGDVGLGVGLAV